MTLLVSWTGVDTHGTASAYIASDSRVTWGNKGHFDHARKVFAFQRCPDILGYCGDVLFPSIVLSQIIEMADRGLLFRSGASCPEKSEAIRGKLVQQFKAYPSFVDGITRDTLQILHVSRDSVDNRQFSCWLIQWNRKAGWYVESKTLPPQSDVLCSLGSGAKEFAQNFRRYRAGPDHGTSRAVFHCFCDTLFNVQDGQCGGAPQLVGLYRKPQAPAISYGIITRGRRYFLGAIVDQDVDFAAVEWRNDLFELCDGQTMKKLDGAQAQPDHLRRN